MKRIELGGKHAVGEHQYALVDDQDYEELSRHRWKAKPNGNKARPQVYAVRNTQVGGKHVTIRMHRHIMGLNAGSGVNGIADGAEVDHRNHNTLDNRRRNLVLSDRRGNANNMSERGLRNIRAQHKINKLWS